MTLDGTYMGQFEEKAGAIVDRYSQLRTNADGPEAQADLVAGETISGVAFTVTNKAGETVPDVIGAHTDSEARTDFRINVPTTAGTYRIEALFSISDGQRIPKHAVLIVCA